MDTLTAMRSNRSVREFRAERLPEEAEQAILDAGRHAGSSKNLQRWAFVVVRDRDMLRRLSKVGQYAGHLAGAAMGIALVTPAPQRDDPLSIMWDLGRCAQNMTLAGWSLGIGSVPATVYDQASARQVLGYPEDHWCEFILSFGYPADASDLTRPPRKGRRRRLGELVHEERW